MDESPLGVALLRDDRYVYLNPRFTEIFGYTLNDFSTVTNGSKRRTRIRTISMR